MLAKTLLLSGAGRLQGQAKTSTNKPQWRAQWQEPFGEGAVGPCKELGLCASDPPPPPQCSQHPPWLCWRAVDTGHVPSQLSIFLAFPGTNVKSQMVLRAWGRGGGGGAGAVTAHGSGSGQDPAWVWGQRTTRGRGSTGVLCSTSCYGVGTPLRPRLCS